MLRGYSQQEKKRQDGIGRNKQEDVEKGMLEGPPSIMIPEILLIGQISEQAPGTLLWRTGQTESKRERRTEGRGKHLQTQGGCHEKVELCESNELRGCTRAALTSTQLPAPYLP